MLIAFVGVFALLFGCMAAAEGTALFDGLFVGHSDGLMVTVSRLLFSTVGRVFMFIGGVFAGGIVGACVGAAFVASPFVTAPVLAGVVVLAALMMNPSWILWLTRSSRH